MGPNKLILPKMIDRTCRQESYMRQREKIIPLAVGNVLEIGIGSGPNIPIYNEDVVKHLMAIDPSREMWDRNVVDPEKLKFKFKFIEASAENIPAANNYFDTLVLTYTLCTIVDLNRAFEEMRRVLKPNGTLLFCEHGKAPERVVQNWQNWINPIWHRFSGGCNINREIPTIISENGFTINGMETMYIPGWKLTSFNYWGTAKPSV